MAGEIGTAYVGVELDTKGVGNQLNGLGGQMQSQLGPLGNVMGASLKAGLIGAAAGAAIAVGKYLYDIGETFDEMADTISTATGATGKDLDGLVEVAKQVGTEVPVSFEDAGSAVAQLAAKTGLAGKPLKDLTVQVTSLAKITDQDLNQVVESSTRLLGDWGLSGADAAEGMDTLFKASQETGVETSKLAELMTKFGAPFRALGFDFTESAALLGKWQAEGVNTELVAGAMRKSISAFAKAGKEPAAGLRETIAEIQRLGPGAKSTALAMDIFGAKAGTDMARAILEGRFAIGGLVKDIDASKSTIKSAEQGTRDFSEQWTLFKNQVAVAVGPAAQAMFAAIGDGMAKLTAELPAIIAMLKEDFGPTFTAIGQTIEDLRPVFEVVFPILVAQIKQTIAAVRLIAEVVAGVVELVSALLRGDWSAAWEAAQRIVGAFATYFKSTFDNVKAYLGAVVTIFATIAKAIGQAISDGVMALVRPIEGLVKGIFNGLVNTIRGVVSTVSSAARAVGEGIKAGVMTAVNTIAGAVRGVFNTVVGAVRAAVGTARSAANAVGDAILNGLRQGLSTIRSVVSTALGKIFDAITAVAGMASGWAMSIGKAIISGVVSGLSGLFSSVKDKIVGGVRGAIDSARDFLGSTAEEYAAANLGKPVTDGVVKGIVAGTKPLSDAIAESVRTAVEAGRTEIEAARTSMGDAWSRLTGDALQAFDALAAGYQTRAEKALAKMEAARAKADLLARKTAAEEALEKASSGEGFEPKEGETPEQIAARQAAQAAAIVAAQKALDDIVYEQKRANLEKIAAEERKQENARVARRRRAFEDELAALQANLAKTGASSGEAQKRIIDLFDKFGVTYKKSGKALGDAFAKTMKDSVEDAATEIRRILRELLEAIEEVRKANNQVKAEAGKGGKGEKSAGAPPPAAGPAVALAGIGGLAPAAQATGGATGLAGPVPFAARARRALGGLELGGGGPATIEAGAFEVRVFIGDTELKGLVRSEVVQIDTGIARTLLAGARI